METSQNGKRAGAYSVALATTVRQAEEARGTLEELACLAELQHFAAARAGELIRELRTRPGKVPLPTLAIMYGLPLSSLHTATTRGNVPIYSKQFPDRAKIRAMRAADLVHP